MSIRIVTDSASDMLTAEAEKLQIDILPLKTIFGEEEYLDGVTLSHEDFYKKLIESDVLPTTSQVTPFEYEEVFRRAVDQGDTVVCITLSSQLSGCYQSAMIAKEEFEEGQVIVIDSLNVSLGQRILVERAIALRDSGMDAQTLADTVEKEKSQIRVIALLDTLEYLKRGGRISSAAAFAGTLLSIKPVVAVEGGKVVVLGKARGSKNGNNMLMDLVRKSGPIDFDRPYCLAYTGLSDDLLQKYKQDSAVLYEGKVDSLPIATIGSTIGTHVGPGAVGCTFFVQD